MISIIICTHNRAPALRRTLRFCENLQPPPQQQIELVVVDNASTDDTATVVETCAPRHIQTRYFFEPKKGLSNARNAGLSNSRGEIILFTDDDVEPAADWVQKMVAPLESGTFDAVTGSIVLADHIKRPWLTPMHKGWIACSEDRPSAEATSELIGASMGFRRSVLEQVPAFDPELGAGALGVGEETLFSWQLREAGLKVGYAPLARVVHSPDPARLKRASWLADAQRRGRTEAYLRYHWQHVDVPLPLLRQLWYGFKLGLRRKLQPPPAAEAEGCAPWEMSYVASLEMCRHFLVERRRQRNYVKHGLKKL